jgi:SAM-dependent methyltransferase
LTASTHYLEYERRYRAAYTQGLAALNPHQLDGYLRTFAEERLAPGVRAIEVGCGEGFDAVAVAALGLDVVALDCSELVLDKARRLNPHPAVEYVRRDVALSIEGYEAGADLIFEFGAYHLLPSDLVRKAYLANVTRMLKPGGYYFFQNGLHLDDVRPTSEAERKLVARRRKALQLVADVEDRGSWFQDPASGRIGWIPSYTGGYTETLGGYTQAIAATGLEIVGSDRLSTGITYPWEARVVARAGDK